MAAYARSINAAPFSRRAARAALYVTVIDRDRRHAVAGRDGARGRMMRKRQTKPPKNVRSRHECTECAWSDIFKMLELMLADWLAGHLNDASRMLSWMRSCHVVFVCDTICVGCIFSSPQKGSALRHYCLIFTHKQTNERTNEASFFAIITPRCGREHTSREPSSDR